MVFGRVICIPAHMIENLGAVQLHRQAKEN